MEAGKSANARPVCLSRRGFASWLRRRVVSRTPAAVVRFGDGEVRVLEADAADTQSVRVANGLIEKQAGRTFDAEQMMEIKAALEHARDRADVLGNLVRGHPLSDHMRVWRDRLAALHAERIGAGNPPEALASCILNHEILAELPKLLAGRRVSVISCRNVKPVLEKKWRLEDVNVYQVPAHHAQGAADGAYEATQYDTPIWPDAHDRVHAELTVRERGEVFLVGAGLFGKDLCIRVRDQGGIALDLGSALDLIAGKLTRDGMRRVIELHASGMSAPEIAADLGARSGVQIDHKAISEFAYTVSEYIRFAAGT